MWTAFFQADGELRHTIAVTKFSWTAEQKAKEFRERMTHPEVGLWWVWIEETGDDDGEENKEAKALSGPKSSSLKKCSTSSNSQPTYGMQRGICYPSKRHRTEGIGGQ